MPSPQQQFQDLIREFEKAIEADKEQIIHEFLERNSWILDFDTYDGLVLSKFRLADKYIPDFVVVGTKWISRDPRPLITFVEIERAGERLYTRNDDPTAFLTHALQQVQDWKRWVEDNRQYLLSELLRVVKERGTQTRLADELEHWEKYYKENVEDGIAYGFTDRYLLVAGRRTQMTVSQRIKLASVSDDLHKTRIVTYDCILEV